MQVDGHSLTGCWFETIFEWPKLVGESALIGAFAKYDYLELSGGATLTKDGASTRFSMDSWHHLFVVGLVSHICLTFSPFSDTSFPSHSPKKFFIF